MKRKYDPLDRDRAYQYLQQFRGHRLLGIVNSVSRSGMSRRIEFYASGVGEDADKIARVGWYMSAIAGFTYDVNKGGILAQGCGMDMIWNCIYLFNISIKRFEKPGHDVYKDDHRENCNYFFPENYST